MGALGAPWQGPSPADDRGLLRQHLQILQAAMAEAPVLPCRAGTVTTRSELALLMEQEYPRLLAQLRRVRGRSEFGLKVFTPAQAPGSPATAAGQQPSGRTYLEMLRARAARQQAERCRAEAIWGQILADLPGSARAEADLAPTEGLLLRAALLLPTGLAAALRARFAAWAERYGAFEWLLSGPWPPYHFVGEEPLCWKRTDGS